MGGSLRNVPAARGQKEKSHTDRSCRERTDVPGRPEKPQVGQKEGRAPSGSSSQQSAPVCCECAVQLVEAAARNRSMSEAADRAHHASERGGGACPSCGVAITRAMRLFS